MKTSRTLFLFFAACSFILSSTVSARAAIRSEIPTVSDFNLNQYLGTWYEVGSIRQWFQKGCVCTKAEYGQRPDGLVGVINSCRKNTLDGKLKVAKGKARFQEEPEIGRLEVSFFPLFWGDYWITELGANYEYSVVTNPEGTSFWILSRTPTLAQDIIEGILQRSAAKGIDVARFELTPQLGCAQ